MGRAVSCKAILALAAGMLLSCGLAGQSRPQEKSGPPRESKKKIELRAARFAGRVEAILGSEPLSKGEWGLVVADAETGATLYEKNADKLFVPASNMKLFTTALALAKLGPDYRFQTTLETRGAISPEGTLDGDLVLVGRGDPNLSNRRFPLEGKEEFDGTPERVLAELADSLVAKGVKRITGDVVGDDSYFPRDRYPSGWEIDDMVWEYGAAISAIAVGDNTVTLTLAPGQRLGDPVGASVTPETPDFLVTNEVVTSAAEVKSELRLTREPGAGRVTVRGTMPANGASRKLVLAIEEPAGHAAALLARLVAARGIQIDGRTRANHEPEPAGTPRSVIAQHVSVPLAQSVKLVNKISQNLHTELLLRAAARQSATWNTPEDLLKFPADFYLAAGIAPGDVLQADGSGLSRHDLVTPRAVTQLLAYALKQPWFPAYYDSLPVAGVDGTLENQLKNTPAAGRIHAKTGSVEHVRTRSGFVETPGGRRLIFSLMSNNLPGKNHEASDALDALNLLMMEEFERPPAKCCDRRRRN